MAPGRFPEHEKLDLIRPNAVICGGFVKWLEQQGYAICTYRDSCGGEYIPANYSLEALLAQRFGIDLEALDAEKRAMLGLARAGDKALEAKPDTALAVQWRQRLDEIGRTPGPEE